MGGDAVRPAIGTEIAIGTETIDELNGLFRKFRKGATADVLLVLEWRGSCPTGVVAATSEVSCAFTIGTSMRESPRILFLKRDGFVEAGICTSCIMTSASVSLPVGGVSIVEAAGLCCIVDDVRRLGCYVCPPFAGGM
jgi:hypothetical protein